MVLRHRQGLFLLETAKAYAVQAGSDISSQAPLQTPLVLGSRMVNTPNKGK